MFDITICVCSKYNCYNVDVSEIYGFLKRYRKSLDKVYAGQYFIQFMASTLVICVTAFQLSVVSLLNRNKNSIYSFNFFHLGSAYQGIIQICVPHQLHHQYGHNAVHSMLLWQRSEHEKRAVKCSTL